jgi:competence ComEA-like helix-hairpin-helix protein
MPYRVSVNSAHPHELLALPGVGPEQAERIVKFRDEHGPIGNESELSRVLGWRGLGESMWGRVDFSATEARRPTSHAAPRFGAPRDDRDAPASTSVKKTG